MALSQADIEAAIARIEGAAEAGQSLGQAFDQAKSAQEPIEIRPEEPQQSTSNREGLEGTSLADAPDVAKPFADARDHRSEQPRDAAAVDLQDTSDERPGSKMVQDDAPPRDLVPPDSPEKRDVDRDHFDAKWDAEHARVADAIERVEAARAADPSQSQDRGMSLD